MGDGTAASRRRATPPPFTSIVWPSSADDGRDIPAATLTELALDGVIEQVAPGRVSGDIAALFRRMPRAIETVTFRQGVLADLDSSADARAAVEDFAIAMREVRSALAPRVAPDFREAQHARFASAAIRYCAAVEAHRDALIVARPASDGLRSWQTYLREYTSGGAFAELRETARRVVDDVARVEYGVKIDGMTLTVLASLRGPTLGDQIERTFARFRDGDAEPVAIETEPASDTERLDQAIIERVARIHPRPFAALDAFVRRHSGFISDAVARFERDIRFYTEYLAFIRPLRAAGLEFCRPAVKARAGLRLRDSFDIAVADRLVDEGRPVVVNDMDLAGRERIAVVTGPNQGGKTTFARMVGQAHVLGALGLLVPGTSASIAMPDRVLTHFEREEDVADLRGKLEDDLRRAHEMMEGAGPSSVLIFNEVLTSTTLDDARDMGERILRRVIERGSRCVFVTFVDELSTLDPSIVSLVCGVEKDDATRRTFRVERRPAEGLAYAAALAERYGLTYDALAKGRRR